MLAGGNTTHLAQFRAGARGQRATLAVVEREGAGVPDGLGGFAPSKTTVWGPGRINIVDADAQERTHDSGGDQLTIQRLHIDFPVDAGPFAVGDLVRVTQNRNSQQVVGRTFRIVALHSSTFQTGQRLPVEEVK